MTHHATQIKGNCPTCGTTPASQPMKSNAKLTAEYLAMTPLQKWETLCLNGLIGYGEPWIEDMRQSLKALSAALKGTE